MKAKTERMVTKDERRRIVEKRKAAAAARKRWMDAVIVRERERIACWMEWYFYNRTYAFTENHSLPPAPWAAKEVEKMMQDLTGAIRRGDALSKNAPIDGWTGGERYEIAFDVAMGQGYRVKSAKEGGVKRWEKSR